VLLGRSCCQVSAEEGDQARNQNGKKQLVDQCGADQQHDYKRAAIDDQHGGKQRGTSTEGDAEAEGVFLACGRLTYSEAAAPTNFKSEGG
jgi:hypothetical protein